MTISLCFDEMEEMIFSLTSSVASVLPDVCGCDPILCKAFVSVVVVSFLALLCTTVHVPKVTAPAVINTNANTEGISSAHTHLPLASLICSVFTGAGLRPSPMCMADASFSIFDCDPV